MQFVHGGRQAGAEAQQQQGIHRDQRAPGVGGRQRQLGALPEARHAARDIGPLISEATNRAAQFLKRLVVLAVVLAIAWFVFQAYANATFFEWLGDRIDGIGEGALLTRRR